MSILSAFLVEDEPHAQELFKLLLQNHCPQIELVGSAFTIAEARLQIDRLNPQLVFLDIELPDGTGFDLLKNYPDREFYVVFVSSHTEYLLEAIKNEAFDFLMKPVDEQELTSTVQRVAERLSSSYELRSSDGRHERLEIKDRKSSLFITKSDIICIEASGSYSEIILRDKRYVVSKNLAVLEKQLDPKIFFRGHHSFLVNLKEVDEFVHEGGYIKLSNEITLRVAARRKTDFFRAMKNV